jgi:pentose-5-phosphate-3-epimerase
VSRAEIVASVLGADYSVLGAEVAELERAGVDRIQWDIMDGRFVPNLTFGADVVAACHARASVPFEAHLMVEDPDPWLGPLAEAGCEAALVHQEACRHLHRTLARTRSFGVRSGVALNPATPLESVRHVLDQVDVLLVMTVDPGAAGRPTSRPWRPRSPRPTSWSPNQPVKHQPDQHMTVMSWTCQQMVSSDPTLHLALLLLASYHILDEQG